MTVVDRLAALLPGEAAEALRAEWDRLTQVRLRPGVPVRLCGAGGGERTAGGPLPREDFDRVLAALMEHSVYARQPELDEGYFTLEDGSRVGVCGRMIEAGTGLRMGEIGSACVRVARPLPGCADALMPLIAPAEGPPNPTLLLSGPGMGKTTLLRDIARQLSDGGLRVGLADERHELAACRMGVPTLDVGARTDVMDGGPKARTLALMLRAMSPQVVVADEIGSEGDAAALADAARCGAAVVSSAHAGSLADALARPNLRAVLDLGALRRVVVLGPRPGTVREVWIRQQGEGAEAWRRA